MDESVSTCPATPDYGTGPLPGRPKSLTTGEVVIIVVILTLAALLAVLGQPMPATLQFVGGVVFLACRAVKALRGLALITSCEVSCSRVWESPRTTDG
ncbi:hypothetical protein ACFVHB_36015 [Kitasatospora sp. NPDC127111]|uniref:hypothetical protein n=1 Tax=Kitasatospora sp. NPDC127111 TaxID=3345363 RepID=UPI003629F028